VGAPDGAGCAARRTARPRPCVASTREASRFASAVVVEVARALCVHATMGLSVTRRFSRQTITRTKEEAIAMLKSACCPADAHTSTAGC
jgi:hypothetical protein